MKTIIQINGGVFGSTGRIMMGISHVAREAGYQMYTFSPPGRSQKTSEPYHGYIGTVPERRICEKINCQTGYCEALNFAGTQSFLKKLDKIRPDIIHLHNIHGNYVNMKMLFEYIKKHDIRVVWTLHDCWAFTGVCPYFDIFGCEKWKTGCYDCTYKGYPAGKIDRSRQLWNLKKECFEGVRSMTLVTPSQWLADLTRESYLKEYPVRVIYNGLDSSHFKPVKSSFREKYNLTDKFIILGVAGSWGIRKGLDRFEELSKVLDDRFQIVLLGIDPEAVKGYNMIAIRRTGNLDELAKIYSAADIMLNPTREDNFPTVNIEALACGTPVISYGAGGSAEAFDENSGMVVTDENVIEVLDELYCKNFSEEDCLKRGGRFRQEDRYEEYVGLYGEILG